MLRCFLVVICMVMHGDNYIADIKDGCTSSVDEIAKKLVREREQAIYKSLKYSG